MTRAPGSHSFAIAPVESGSIRRLAPPIRRSLGSNPIPILLLLAYSLAATALPAGAATLVRGPYLQQPTANRIIVRWRTDVATDSRVEYGLAFATLDATVDDATATTEHQVTLGGLSPDTVYFYRIGSTTEVLAGGDADHHFTTSPETGTPKPTRIWAIGDSGFPDPAVIAPGWIRDGDAVRDAYTAFNGGVESADVWLMLGDNAYFSATDAEYQTAVFGQYPAFLRTVAPWGCLGNHEGASANGLTQTGPYFDVFTLPTNGEAGGVPSGTEAYYSFDYGNIHFVVLDAEDAILNATARDAMLGWLEADLAASTADWLIAFWHQPPYSKGFLHDSDSEANEVQIRAHALPILEDFGVDLVLAGHSHTYERSYLIDGHYGHSSTFGPAHKVDGGDGDPLGDGAYEKLNEGPSPHDGAVYVVAGSASEVRPGNGVHPVMAVSLTSLGSLVLDVDGNTATGRFLDQAGVVQDTFVVEKRIACPDTPAAGCVAAARSRLLLTDRTNDARDNLFWRWKNGVLHPADIGDPYAGSDRLDVCVYDGNGYLVGGALPPGAPGWSFSGGLLYEDDAALPPGLYKVKVKSATSPRGSILARGKGAYLRTPQLPVTLPVTAQLKNDTTGKCWESVFSAPDVVRNDDGKFVARQ